MKVKKVTLLLIAAILIFSCFPAALQAAGHEIALDVISEKRQGDSVTLKGTTTLTELNVKVVNSKGMLIYVNTFKPGQDGAYSHLFTLSQTEELGKTTVVIGEGNVVASREFMITASSSGGGAPGGGGGLPGGGLPGGELPGDGSELPDEEEELPEQPASEDDNDDITVWVNGKAENAGTSTTETVHGKRVTTVSVDPTKLAARLAAEGANAFITIKSSKLSDKMIGQLDGQMVSSMEQQAAVLNIQTTNASYTLPADQLNIRAISDQFGQNVELSDISIQIEIASLADDIVKVVEDAMTQGSLQLMVPAVEFTVSASYGGRTIEVSHFNAYVERMIALPANIDPYKITTGIIVEKDGTIRHVPTKVIRHEDGSYYAQINSLSNSVYAVIWSPRTFKDVEQHWAKAAVNDMASRLIVQGDNAENFNPDQSITRAEFAAIVVRGLGLKPQTGAASFTDVSASAWYSDVIDTANAYDLISGYTDGSFRPTESITREQAAVILANAMRVTGLQADERAGDSEWLAAFSDSSNVSSWAYTAVADSLKHGIIGGRSSSQLAPKEHVTRAEVAVMLKRLLQKSELI